MTVKEKMLSSIKPVIEQSEFVRTDLSAVQKMALELKGIEIPRWNQELQLLSNDEETVQYYFFVDSMQGCSWPEKGKDRWYFRKDNEWIKGYYAFSYSIKRAALKDKKYLNADYLSTISYEDFCEIFRGKGELQLMPQRHESIKQNFSTLKQKYAGKAANLVKSANKNVSDLVFKIVKEFPSFDDKAIYNGQEVYFWKRAQIFPNDIHFALSGKGLGEFANMNELTIFADYKLPQLLQSYGVLVYNEDLTNRIQSEVILAAGSPQEVEIRAHTIHACELLTQELMKLGRTITSQQLDWILWNLSQKMTVILPHHRTPTIFY